MLSTLCCECCGAPEARLYAYWPARLCPKCAAERAQASRDEDAANHPPDFAKGPQAMNTGLRRATAEANKESPGQMP